MAWWIWIILGAILLAAEVIISADFYLVFFGLAAVVLGLLGVFGLVLPNWAQFLLFAALAVFGLVFYRGRWKKILSKADREMSPELVGETPTAQAAIAAGGRGRVDLRGAAWDACNTGAVEIAAGSRCIVERVDGLTLHVRAES
ncbi:MAG: NfeD family protein [Candidatus Krumholzibacteria bacterium]|jgi:membrane protein implicated in regulation of membrane protease activity|nr:NfeD family protein [Candidatus Krumholzibacteria bacterium]